MTEDGRDGAEAKPNRRVKDSMFVDLFARDRDAKRNFVSLYNALRGASLPEETTEVTPETLENTVYMTYANDIAMLVDGRIVVLIEHQSTINRNMPLRLLDYVTRIYERLVSDREKFRRQMVEIPAPEFYVLYNGEEELPAEGEMRLSDAFVYDKGERPAEMPLELVVKVYNINPGRGDKLLGRCEALRQYSQFISLVRYARGRAAAERTDEPLTWAVKEAVRRGILPEYLKRKASEVINMLNVEYDYETDLATRWEEGLNEGMRRGHESGLREGHESGLREGHENGVREGLAGALRNLIDSMKLPAQQAMDILKIPEEDRAKYAAMLS